MALGFRIPNEALGGIADMGAAPVTPTSEPASPKMEMPDYTKISGITPETRDALATRQAIVGDTEQQYLQALRSKGELESAQALATAEAETKRSRGKASVIEDFAKQERESQELANLEEAEKAARMSEFVPSKENVQDLAQLFGLISAIGFAIGAGGKGSAMQAMSAMNGMLEGHRLGREDLYKKEKDLFDINLKKLMKTVEMSKAAYERYRALASTKREAALANLDADFSAAGADFLKKYSKQFGDAKTVDVLNALLQMKNKVAETVEKERLNAEARAARVQQAKEAAQARTEAARAAAAAKTTVLGVNTKTGELVVQHGDGRIERIAGDFKDIQKIGGAGGKPSALIEARQNIVSADIGNTYFRMNEWLGTSKDPNKIPSGSTFLRDKINQSGIADAFKNYLINKNLPSDLQSNDAALLGIAFDIAAARSQGLAAGITDSKIRQLLAQMPIAGDKEETKRIKLRIMINQLDEANRLLPENKKVDGSKYMVSPMAKSLYEKYKGPSGQEQPISGVLPTPQTQEEYDSLPLGTKYIDPDTGEVHEKGKRKN